MATTSKKGYNHKKEDFPKNQHNFKNKDNLTNKDSQKNEHDSKKEADPKMETHQKKTKKNLLRHSLIVCHYLVDIYLSLSPIISYLYFLKKFVLYILYLQYLVDTQDKTVTNYKHLSSVFPR